MTRVQEYGFDPIRCTGYLPKSVGVRMFIPYYGTRSICFSYPETGAETYFFFSAHKIIEALKVHRQFLLLTLLTPFFVGLVCCLFHASGQVITVNRIVSIIHSLRKSGLISYIHSFPNSLLLHYTSERRPIQSV